METERIPFVGADVHFVAPGNGLHCAAKVTMLAMGQPNGPDGKAIGGPVEIAVLTVFKPNGIDFMVQSIQDEVAKQQGTWHWIEKPTRVQAAGANGFPRISGYRRPKD